MLDYVKRFIDIESINDYEKADIILNIIFTGINFLITILTVALFSTQNKEITYLSYQIIGIFFVDVIIRLYHIYMLQKDISNILLKEIIASVIGLDQLYLILSLFCKVINLLKIKETISILLPCLLYLLVFFSYEKFITYSPIVFDAYLITIGSLILLTQYLFCAIYVYYIYDLLKPGIDQIIARIIQGGKKLSTFHKFIIGAPSTCLILFTAHYMIKITILFVKSPFLIFYGNLIINIFKEGGKYFSFGICLITVYALNRHVFDEKQKKNNSEEIQNINL